MYTLDDEDDLLRDVEDGVELALHRGGHDPDRLDPITFNKLAYFAITEFDVPVTFGWYKYGPAPVDVTSTEVDLAARSPDDLPAADEPRLRGTEFRSPEEYSYFFTEDLEEFDRILQTPTKEYLVGFYFDHAPDRYRDLYVASAELQQTIDTIRDDPSWHDDALAHLDDLERRYARVVAEATATPTLEEAVLPLQDYGDLLADVVTAAADRSELDPARQRFLGRVVEGFYGGPWNLATLLVSHDTVDRAPGTNQRILRNAIENDLQALRNEYDAKLGRLEERAEGFELLPDERRNRFGDVDDTADVVDAELDESNTASLDDLRGRLE